MSAASRPHVLGIDDGPFDKGQSERVPIVGVMMEGGDLCEVVALTEFAVDGEGATHFLTSWIESLRLRPTLQAIVLGGITIAGLGIVEIGPLSDALGVPVVVVTRRDPTNHRLLEALAAAGLSHRRPLVERTPSAFRAAPGLWVAHAGIDPEGARQLIRATLRKSTLPEPLRLAHLIASALVRGESHGRP
ncbi:MAG: DUF99 family protein [Myxococcota bacterium]